MGYLLIVACGALVVGIFLAFEYRQANRRRMKLEEKKRESNTKAASRKSR